jgi:predicted amidohydrolase
MEQLLKDVKADLIVLPELATSGYLFGSKKEVKYVSESPESGPTALLFKRLAKENDCSYVVGFSEVENDKFYNSAMLVNPDGKIFVYRKTHLFYEEKKWFEPGNTGLRVFEAKGGVKVGLMICFDWIFPEAARTLALNGAEIIAHPANLVLPWCQQAMITRSLENRVFSVTANRTGLEQNNDSELYFTGQSQILTTKGEILNRMNEIEEAVYVTEIETEKANNKDVTEFNNIFADRRTEMYV